MTSLAIPRSLGSRRGAAAVAGFGITSALSLATLSSPSLNHLLGQGISDSIHGVKTVAAMLAERSPGQRPEGALANLKPKKWHAVLSDRLPKVTGPGPTPYEALAGPAPMPSIVVPPEAPLFTALGGPPPEAITTTGSSGGPAVLSNIPPPGGGGGGGAFVPPTTMTTVTPSVPVAPVAPVPEPATWAMMIVGFAMVGATLRRRTVPANS